MGMQSFITFPGKIRGIIPYQPQFTKYDVDLVANGDGEDGSQPCPQCDDNQVSILMKLSTWGWDVSNILDTYVKECSVQVIV